MYSKSDRVYSDARAHYRSHNRNIFVDGGSIRAEEVTRDITLLLLTHKYLKHGNAMQSIGMQRLSKFKWICINWSGFNFSLLLDGCDVVHLYGLKMIGTQKHPKALCAAPSGVGWHGGRRRCSVAHHREAVWDVVEFNAHPPLWYCL